MNSQGVFRKISHAPYHSAKILFYFCATNFFRSAFSSLATRKNEASSPPSVATAKGRNSILWTSFKNKPTFRKNTTTFLTFSTGLKQGIMTRRNNIRQKVKFLAHSTSSHARGKNAFTAPRPTHPLRLDNHPRQKKRRSETRFFTTAPATKTPPFHPIPERVVADIMKTSGKNLRLPK